MDRLTAFARVAVSTAVAVAVLAGCRPGEMKAVDWPDSVAEMTPKVAMLAGLAATKAAGPLVYTGRVQEFFAGAARPLDAELTLDGEDCALELTSDDLGSITVRIVDELLYVRATTHAFQQLLGISRKDASTIGDRWLGSPVPGDMECDPVEIAIGELDRDTCTSGGGEDIDGTPTIYFRCRANGFEQRVYLATEGAPVLVRVETVGMSGTQLTLADRPADVEIEAPPDAEIIDLTDIA